MPVTLPESSPAPTPHPGNLPWMLMASLPATDIWIGRNFQPGKSILILGESSYNDPCECQTSPCANLQNPPLRQYVPCWIDQKVSDYTFARIFNAFYGASHGTNTEKATVTQRSAFWEEIAFYNLVIGPLGSREDRDGIQRMYQCGIPQLEEVLKALEPGGVMILGIEQGKYSEPVVKKLGIPCVVTAHPTARGVSTATLTAKWNKLVATMN